MRLADHPSCAVCDHPLCEECLAEEFGFGCDDVICCTCQQDSYYYHVEPP